MIAETNPGPASLPRGFSSPFSLLVPLLVDIHPASLFVSSLLSQHDIPMSRLQMTRMSDDELYEMYRQKQIAHLTSQGDGSDRQQQYEGQTEDERQEMQQVAYCNHQEIVPGLFIGDYTAAMDGKLLKEKNITFVVAASKLRDVISQGVFACC